MSRNVILTIGRRIVRLMRCSAGGPVHVRSVRRGVGRRVGVRIELRIVALWNEGRRLIVWVLRIAWHDRGRMRQRVSRSNVVWRARWAHGSTFALPVARVAWAAEAIAGACTSILPIWLLYVPRYFKVPSPLLQLILLARVRGQAGRQLRRTGVVVAFVLIVRHPYGISSPSSL